MTKKGDQLPASNKDYHSRNINIGIGDYKIAASPYYLHTVLGSCVGVMVYDEALQIGGLAHVYLPYTHEFSRNSTFSAIEKHLSFADILIPRMLKELEARQGKRARFQVHITGGGYILPVGDFPRLDIGQRNIEAVRDVLSRERLRARELHLGGKSGQSVIFNLYDGGIEIKLHS